MVTAGGGEVTAPDIHAIAARRALTVMVDRFEVIPRQQPQGQGQPARATSAAAAPAPQQPAWNSDEEVPF